MPAQGGLLRCGGALQVLDDVKQGLTYAGWERDVLSVEGKWTIGQVNIQTVVGRMRRKQCLHAVLS